MSEPVQIDPEALKDIQSFLANAWSERSDKERKAFGASLGLSEESVLLGTRLPTVEPADEAAVPIWADTSYHPLEPAPQGGSTRPEGTVVEDYSPQSAVARDNLNASAPARADSKFEPIVPPPLPPEPGALGKAASSAEKLGAVSGSVSPEDLVTGESESLRLWVLDAIAPSFDKTVEGKTWVWTMKTDRRRAILGDLTGQLLTETLTAAEGVSTDDAGRRLRVLLRDGVDKLAVDLDKLESGTLQPKLQALAWASLDDPAAVALTHDIQRRLAVAGILETYGHLLREGFYGREGQIKRLGAFVEELRREGPIPLLSISGIGGMGKSTLLAAAFRPRVEAAFEFAEAPIIVTLDFDRRLYGRGGELELTFELTRQLGYFVPAAGRDLAAARDEMRRLRLERGEHLKEDPEGQLSSADRTSDEFAHGMRDIVKRHAVNLRPLIMVLDTFEGWQRQTYDLYDPERPDRRVLDWAATVREAWGLTLGIVISGRAPIAASGYAFAKDPIELGGLSRGDATKLLRGMRLDAGGAKALARVVGGNPLALRLAGRLYLRLPLERRKAFLYEGARDLEGLDDTLRQGVLYRRFLAHIEDKNAQKVAHPGLALRRVTPELIQGVLAEPCDLGPLSLEAATQLLDSLAREVWLVERDPRGGLSHRPGVRGAMLRAMSDDPEHADRIRAVHAAAADWYASGPGATEPDAEFEAAYHRISLLNGATFERDGDRFSSKVLAALRGAIGDFEPDVQALLKAKLGLPLADEDGLRLPTRLRWEWADKRASELVSRSQPKRALVLWERATVGMPSGTWYAQAVFQANDWDEASRQVDFDTAALASVPLKYHYLLAFAREGYEADALFERLDDLFDAQLDVLRTPSPGELTSYRVRLENLYFRSVLRRIRPREVELDQARGARGLKSSALGATEILRFASIGESLSSLRPKNSRHFWSAVFRPEQDWLETLAQRLEKKGLRSSRLREFIRELTNEFELADGETDTSDLLGPWADRFAKAMDEDGGDENSDDWFIKVLPDLRSEDSEWRLPLREMLNRTVDSPIEMERFLAGCQSVFGFWMPSDLKARIAERGKLSRSFWLRVVEYADRMDLLPALLKLQWNDNRDMPNCAKAYLSWHARVKNHLRRSMP